MKIAPEVEAKFPRLAENVHMWNRHAADNWDSSVSANLIITEARPNFLVFEFVVGEGHVNGYALRHLGNSMEACILITVQSQSWKPSRRLRCYLD